jgi:predicted  nucleic acid-binding Zn-ribbon protein
VSVPELEGQHELLEEIGHLQARLAQLESELVEVQARANAAVAEAQEKAYWLDRLHIDLNAVMRRPGANEVRIVLRAVRSVLWRLKRIKRRLFGPR